jgi:hypothetical protein
MFRLLLVGRVLASPGRSGNAVSPLDRATVGSLTAPWSATSGQASHRANKR